MRQKATLSKRGLAINLSSGASLYPKKKKKRVWETAAKRLNRGMHNVASFTVCLLFQSFLLRVELIISINAPL